MVLEGKTQDGKNASIRYVFELEDGTVLQTAPNNINGTEIVSFTENGTKSFTVKPILTDSLPLREVLRIPAA